MSTKREFRVRSRGRDGREDLELQVGGIRSELARQISAHIFKLSCRCFARSYYAMRDLDPVIKAWRLERE